MHAIVKATKKPNYMQARLPVNSQLKVDAWKRHLEGYWNEQLLHLIEFGFSLDFNRNCPLNHESGNHKSATDLPSDIDAYIEEELKYDALLGPFEKTSNSFRSLLSIYVKGKAQFGEKMSHR